MHPVMQRARPLPRFPRLARCAAGTLASLFVAVPAVLPAQNPVATPDTVAHAQPTQAPADSGANGRTHTVKRGDTLWDLGRTYLNDPFQWPQIYRLNTSTVQNPHWIYPGQVLQLPGDVQVAASTRVIDQSAEPDGAAAPGGPTVFSQSLAARGMATSRLLDSPSEYAHTAVRVGEFYAAPWMDRDGGPEGQGLLLRSAGIPGIKEFSDTRRLGPQSRAYITLPKGIVAARGDRFLVFDKGPTLDGGGQVMVPTGIVEVESTDNGGVATTVRIVQQFGEVVLGQSVVPLSRFSMPTEARPQQLALGLESHVVYLPSRAVLPTIQRYVMLSATSRDGVQPGDQFTLYRPRQQVQVPGQDQPVTVPEEPIALAQVVKVTDRGTTALIVSQREPAIKVGVNARLTARMP